MPETFDRCVRDGGRVRTLKNGRLICYPKGGGKPVTAPRESKKQLTLIDVASKLLNTPIALDARTLDALIATFLHNNELYGDEDGLVDLSSFFFLFDDGPTLKTSISNGVATISIPGPLSKDDFFGTRYSDIRNAIDAMLSNDEAKKVLLSFDSPGGTVAGMFELADYIYSLRGNGKPIWAIADSMAASAAYALASATDRVLTTETGVVGSVGILARHIEYSKQNEMRGVKVTHIYAGERKVDGSRDMPLSKEAKNSIQADVDSIYESFVERVAKHRGVTEKAVRSTEAATYLGEAGVKIGFADGLTTGVDAVEELSKFKATSTSVSVSKSGAEHEDTEVETMSSKSDDKNTTTQDGGNGASAPKAGAEVVDIDEARNTARSEERDRHKKYVSQVKNLCMLAGCPERAIEFIEADTELDSIQKTLLDEKAKAAEEEEEVSGHTSATAFTPRKIDARAIYQKRRETVAKYQQQSGAPK